MRKHLILAALAAVLLAACGGGGGDDPDADLREWCRTFVGPLTPEQRAECDRVGA